MRSRNQLSANSWFNVHQVLLLYYVFNKHLLNTYNVQCIVVARDIAVHKTEDNPCALTELTSIKVISFSIWKGASLHQSIGKSKLQPQWDTNHYVKIKNTSHFSCWNDSTVNYKNCHIMLAEYSKLVQPFWITDIIC